MTLTPLMAQTGARDLLALERYGFAIDATSYDTVTAAAYTGGPVGGTLAIHADNVTDKPNIPMDAAAGLLKGASPLVQSGTSPKMVHFPTSPYVRWSPHNLVSQSQTFDNASWAKSACTITADSTTAPDGTVTADTMISTGAGSQRRMLNIASPVAGFVYTASIYAKAAVEDWLFFEISDFATSGAGSYFDLTNGVTGTTVNAGSMTLISKSITSAGSGWYRCSVTAAVTTANHGPGPCIAQADNDQTVADLDSIYVWGAQMVKGYEALPYLVTTSAARIGIPQSYDTAAAQYGILVEPAATNLAIRSEELDGAAWNPSNITVTQNATVAPDGATTAENLRQTTTSGFIRHTSAMTVSSGAVYTASCYAKYNNIAWLRLSVGADDVITNGCRAWFDIQSGTVGSTANVGSGWTAGTPSIVSIGNGWYRCTFSLTTGATTAYIQFRAVTADAANTGAGTTDDYYVWGVQLETGTVATSYIPTLGSTVTRAVDVINVSTSMLPFSTTTGAMVSYFKHIKSAGSSPSFCAFSGGSDAEVIYNTIRHHTDSKFSLQVRSGSTNTSTPVTHAGISPSVPSTHRVGAAWAANDTAITDNAGTVGTDSSVTMATGISTFRIGVDAGYSGSELDIYMLHYQFVYVPRRMTNTELQAKTT